MLLSKPVGHFQKLVFRLSFLSKKFVFTRDAYLESTTPRRSHVLNSPHHIALQQSRFASSHSHYPNVTLSVCLGSSDEHLDNFLKNLLRETFPLSCLNVVFTGDCETGRIQQKLKEFSAASRGLFASVSVRETNDIPWAHDATIAQSEDPFVLVADVEANFLGDSIAHIVDAALADVPTTAAWELRQFPFERDEYYDPVTLETPFNSYETILLRTHAYQSLNMTNAEAPIDGMDAVLSCRFRAAGWVLRYIPWAMVKARCADQEHSKPGAIATNILLRYRYGNRIKAVLLELFLRLRAVCEWCSPQKRTLRKALGIVSKMRSSFAPDTSASEIVFPAVGGGYCASRPAEGVSSLPAEETLPVPYPLVTIITRTYGNRLNYLSEAMACVLNQAYPNIEHLVIEDRSDNAEALVTKTAENYGANRLRYSKSDGAGRSRAGNFGIEQANGEFIVFLDDDDLLFSDHVQLLMQTITEQNTAVAYAYAWEVQTEAHGDGHYRECRPYLDYRYDIEFSKDRLLQSNFIPIQAALFRKELYEQYGGMPENVDQLEDWTMWVRFAEAGEFTRVPKVTSMYRIPTMWSVRKQRSSAMQGAYKSAVERNTGGQTTPQRTR